MRKEVYMVFMGILVLMVVLAACTKEVEVIKGVEVIEEVEVEKSTTSRLDVVKARGKVICASRNDVLADVLATVLWTQPETIGALT